MTSFLSLVEKTFRENPRADAVYFQGATMDPLPIIQRLENALAVPVITSNSAMIWNLLSKLGLQVFRPRVTADCWRNGRRDQELATGRPNFTRGCSDE